ncbi:hypothetical protein ACHAWF_009906 [Thalassiosira exigua]
MGTNARATCKLVVPDGYLSCVRFVNEGHIVTSPGDFSCKYWVAQSGNVVNASQSFSSQTDTLWALVLTTPPAASSTCNATAK